MNNTRRGLLAAGRIQQTAAEVAAKYPRDSLRAKKQEIADAVKQDVTAFFAQRGITITTVGMFGGMTHENAAIQKAIDETVIAQQLKVVSEAKFSAQQRENDRIERWTGAFPQTMLGNNPNLLFTTPLPALRAG